MHLCFVQNLIQFAVSSHACLSDRMLQNMSFMSYYRGRRCYAKEYYYYISLPACQLLMLGTTMQTDTPWWSIPVVLQGMGSDISSCDALTMWASFLLIMSLMRSWLQSQFYHCKWGSSTEHMSSMMCYCLIQNLIFSAVISHSSVQLVTSKTCHSCTRWSFIQEYYCYILLLLRTAVDQHHMSLPCRTVKFVLNDIRYEGLRPQLICCAPFPSIAPYFRILYLSYLKIQMAIIAYPKVWMTIVWYLDVETSIIFLSEDKE